MRFITLICSSLLTIVFGISNCTLEAATQLPAGFQEELEVYGLNLPTAAEYAPDGRLFILEKGGRIRIFKNGSLLKKPFLVLGVDSFIERGLLGIAFDPNFLKNHYIYIYRTTPGSDPKNQVERYTATGDVAQLTSRKVLVSGINSDAGFHNAGWLRFGPDGKLYISTGDGGVHQDYAQDHGSLNGKILRINPDGTIPDNPFVSVPGARGEVWAYGLRNPWRFAIHPVSGFLAIGDVGENAYEEMNAGVRGGNYGWPDVEGPTPGQQYLPPAYSYSHVAGGASIVAGVFYTGMRYPGKFQNQLFFTDYVQGFIKVLRFQPNGSATAENFATGLGSPVHMLLSPDGSLLYVSLNRGEIRRIRYVGGRNRPPVAEAHISRRAGPLPLAVRFASDGTFDPDGDALTYHWDFGDGFSAETPVAVHTYANAGVYYSVLTVRDNHGGFANSQSFRITAGNNAPEVRILQPVAGRTVRPGQTVNFAGRATDPEDGSVSPQNLLWTIKLYHNEHTHPFLNGVHGLTGSFTVPIEVHGEGNLFFRIQLRATDSAGLSNSAFVDVKLLP